MTCPHPLSNVLAGMKVHQPCMHRHRHRSNRRHCLVKAQLSTQQPRTPSPTSEQQPTTHTELTLIETQGRSQTTHTWSLTTSSTSSISSQDEHSSNGQLQYTQAQQQLPTQQAGNAPDQQLPSSSGQLQQLREALSVLFLPAGYPDSVTDDYLAYQLTTVPAHITGWLSISLTTSSLLKAVGISAGPVGATAAAAAIKWIVKDGIGAAGRLLVGGRLGLEFDDDPRRWRMTAEALTTLGLALEIGTTVFPQQFLLLASLGNFSKAVGKGMGKPVFRVIQTHFAAAGNVGAVAAKEEVWEVAAQLVGYGLSVLLLQHLQDAGSWQTVVGIWALVQGAHVGFRYAALKQLRFRYLNQKRAKLLVCDHVRGQPLPSVAAANQQEPMFKGAADMAPNLVLGASLADAWGCAPQELQPEVLAAWWGLYEQEGYLLVWREGRAAVVLKEEARDVVAGQRQRGHVLLRALWQAAWIDAYEHGQQGQQQQQQQQQGNSAGLSSMQSSETQQQDQQLRLLQASLQALNREFMDFDKQAEAAGWHTEQLVLKVGASRVQQLLPAGSDSDFEHWDP